MNGQRLSGHCPGGQIPPGLHEGLPSGTEEGEEAAKGWGVGPIERSE